MVSKVSYYSFDLPFFISQKKKKKQNKSVILGRYT